MKIFQPKNKAGFTLVEIMIVVLIIGILLAIAIPNFVAARESSRAKACIGNLKQIDSATQQYCMDQKLSGATTGATSYISNLPTLNTVALTGLVSAGGSTSGYLRTTPVCPASGAYSVAPTISDSPYCAISGNATNKTAVTGSNSTDTNYSSGAKFYHGL